MDASSPEYDPKKLAAAASKALGRVLHGGETEFFGSAMPAANGIVSYLLDSPRLHKSHHLPPKGGLDDPEDGFGSNSAEQRHGRRLSASFIKWVLSDPTSRAWFQKFGLEIWGARIEGELDLGFFQIPFRLHFLQCWFGVGSEPKRTLTHKAPTLETAHLSLRYAKVFSLSLSGSRVEDGHHVCMRGIVVERSLFLRRGFKTGGQLSLTNAKIKGDLDLQGAEINAAAAPAGGAANSPEDALCKPGRAVEAEGVRVGGTIYLSKGFKAIGRVDLHQAKVQGDINGIGGRFVCPDGEALRLRKALVEGSVLLRHRHQLGTAGVGDHATILEGQLSMESAQIRGNLILTGGKFTHPTLVDAGSPATTVSSPHFAVQAEGAHVGGQVKLDWAVVTGQLRFENARIGGDFFGEALHVRLGVRLKSSKDPKLPARLESRLKVLSLEKACVGGSIVLWRSERRPDRKPNLPFFPASLKGVVDLRGAQVHGNISLAGAQIGYPARLAGGAKRPPALLAEGLQVKGRVGLDGGFEARGKISFHNVIIDGDFSARGCKFHNAEGLALELANAQIGGSFYLQSQPPRQQKAAPPKAVAPEPTSRKPESRFLPCVVEGSLNLSGATIKGNIVIRGAQCTAAQTGDLQRPKHSLRASLCARDVTVHGHVLIGRGQMSTEEDKSELSVASDSEYPPAKFSGPVDLRRATISGTLSILDAHLFAQGTPTPPATSNPSLHVNQAGFNKELRECALRLEGASIGGSIQTRDHLPYGSQGGREGALFFGGIDLRNTRVKGDLNLHSAWLIGDPWYYDVGPLGNAPPRAHRHEEELSRPACWATNAVIEGNVSFRESKVFGVITFYSARIGGRLNLRGIRDPLAPPELSEKPRAQYVRFELRKMIDEPRARLVPIRSYRMARLEEVTSQRYISVDLLYLRCDVLQIDGESALRGCLALDGLTYRGLDLKPQREANDRVQAEPETPLTPQSAAPATTTPGQHPGGSPGTPAQLSLDASPSVTQEENKAQLAGKESDPASPTVATALGVEGAEQTQTAFTPPPLQTAPSASEARSSANAENTPSGSTDPKLQEPAADTSAGSQSNSVAQAARVTRLQTTKAVEETHPIVEWLMAQHAKDWYEPLKNRSSHKLPLFDRTFPPQPYRLAIAVLERQGMEEHAEKVVAELRKLEGLVEAAQFKSDQRASWRKCLAMFNYVLSVCWRFLDRRLLRHGYRHGGAFFLLGLLQAFGGLVFWLAACNDCMVPTQESAWHGFDENHGRRHPEAHWSPYYPHFRPWIYSLDLCLPFMDFGQSDFWEPNPDWMEHAGDEHQAEAPSLASSAPTPQPQPAGEVSLPVVDDLEESDFPDHESLVTTVPGPSDPTVQQLPAKVVATPANLRQAIATKHPFEGVLVNPPGKTWGQWWFGNIAYFYLPAHIICGWLLSTLSVLGFTRLLRHRREEIPGGE